MKHLLRLAKKARIPGAAVVLALALASQANASPTLDFAMISPTPGFISYAGGAAPLVGTGIQVDNVTGGLAAPSTFTPLNNGVVALCVSCTLNFTSGAHTGTAWNWLGGGSITLVGGIDFPDATPDIPTGTTLFSGSINSAQVIAGGDFGVNLTAFNDTKDPALAAFYGLLGGPTHTWSGGFNLSFFFEEGFGAGDEGQAFTTEFVGSLASGDITNHPAPEPSTLLLLGSGLVGLAGWGRKRMKK